MSVSMDMSQVRTLAIELAEAPDKVLRGMVPIMRKAGLQTRRRMQKDLQGSTYFKGAGFKMSVDEHAESDAFEVEIYPHHGKRIPSSLYNVAVFGTSRGGGTVRDPVEALQEEAELANGYLEKLIGDVL